MIIVHACLAAGLLLSVSFMFCSVVWNSVLGMARSIHMCSVYLERTGSVPYHSQVIPDVVMSNIGFGLMWWLLFVVFGL